MRLRWCALVVGATLIGGCDNQARETPPAQPVVNGDTLNFPRDSQQLKEIVTAPAVERPAPTVTLNGKLTWNEDRTVRIYTPLGGQVSRILVKPGDRVARGQALAIIASPDLGQAQADSNRAQTDFSLSKQTLARINDLHEHGVVSAKDVDAAQADFDRAQSELQRTQARLRLYGGAGRIDQTYTLTSPLTGVVVEKNVNPGQELRPDQMGSAPALFTISDPAYLWALLDAAEKDLPHLKLGSAMKIQTPAYPDDSFSATITAVADFLDPATRTIKVRAALDNTQHKLKGEMFVTGTLMGPQRLALQVPSRAVFFQGGKHMLFVAGKDASFTRQEITIGETYEGNVTVLSGLSAGQQVVTEGALLLQQLVQPHKVMN